MNKPLVAVVGRPNVGKSTFFNKIAGSRISIVKDLPGVTRDRLYADAEWCGYNFTLIDTGGIGLSKEDEFTNHIKQQAQIAIESAAVILFIVDGKDGLMVEDYAVADILRTTKKPVILAVNKLDNFDISLTYEFYNLGLGEPFAISAEQGKGLGDLLDEVVKKLPKQDESEQDDSLKIAVVGKPNVGKSSLVNKILGYKRVIVSDVAGTTRDAIDTPFTLNGQDYTIIDTAGMRKKKAIDGETVESYSVMRSILAIKRADIVLIVIDATEPLSEQDIKIAGLVHEEGKPSLIVINKWDCITKDTFTIEKFEQALKIDLKFMDYFKSIYVSALTGQRVEKIIEITNLVYENASKRITTSTLNDIIGEAVSLNEPPSKNGRKLKIYYATQSSVCPPKFILFVNDNELVHFSYKRYLENCLRRSVDFAGTPIQLQFNNKKKDED